MTARPGRASASRRHHSSRSAKERYRPDSGAKSIGDMPPLSRNHLTPTTGDNLDTTAASSLDSPAAIASQNRCRCSRRPAVGRPGDGIGGRPARSDRRRLDMLIATPSCCGVLRRPVESAQYLSIRYSERLAEVGAQPSVGSTGDSYDNALAETVIGLFKTEVIRHRGPWKTSTQSSIQPSSGLTGSIIAGCCGRSGTSHRQSWKRRIIANKPSRPQRPDSNEMVSGEPGAVHLGRWGGRASAVVGGGMLVYDAFDFERCRRQCEETGQCTIEDAN